MYLKYFYPLVTVSNIAISRQFYETILGQKIKFDFGENISFEGDFAIHLQSHFQSLINGKEIIRPNNSFELYFESDDLNQLTKNLNDHKVEFIHYPKEQPWRQLVTRFYDPDFNIIEVGESMESLVFRLNKDGMKANEIVSVTSLQPEFVHQIISNLTTEKKQA